MASQSRPCYSSIFSLLDFLTFIFFFTLLLQPPHSCFAASAECFNSGLSFCTPSLLNESEGRTRSENSTEYGWSTSNAAPACEGKTESVRHLLYENANTVLDYNYETEDYEVKKATIRKELEIHIYDDLGAHITHIILTNTGIYPATLKDWNSLAVRIFQLWRKRNETATGIVGKRLNPKNCWPGFITRYRMYMNADIYEEFDPKVSDWKEVRRRLNRLDLWPDDKDEDEVDGKHEKIMNELKIVIHYGLDGNSRETINSTGIFPDSFEDWNGLARQIFHFWRYNINGNSSHTQLIEAKDLNPDNCWPGFVTHYGDCEDNTETFEQFSQYNNKWVQVREHLNCLELWPEMEGDLEAQP